MLLSSRSIRMSFKNRFADIPIFDGSNWLSWSARMSQFLMANKVWSYVIGTYTKPAPIREMISAPAASPQPLGSSSSCPAATTLGPVTNSKEIADWINDDGSAIRCIKMKYQEAIVMDIPTTPDTSKKVWEDLKKKYDKASTASILQKIHKVFSFWLSGGDPTNEIQKLAAMFAHLEQCGFMVSDFVQASILIIVIPQKWDMISTWLLSYYSLDKLEYSVVANMIIGVTILLTPNHDCSLFTHYSDPIALDSSYMTHLLRSQSVLTVEFPLLDYFSHDYSALLRTYSFLLTLLTDRLGLCARPISI